MPKEDIQLIKIIVAKIIILDNKEKFFKEPINFTFFKTLFFPTIKIPQVIKIVIKIEITKDIK